MKIEDFEKIKESINNSTSKIREIYNRVVSDVNFQIDEEIYEGMIYRIIYGAAVNSGFIKQKEDKSEERAQQGNIFFLLHQELMKKKYSKLNLEALLEKDIVDNKIVEDSKLFLIWKATQTEKRYIPPLPLPTKSKQINSKIMNEFVKDPKRLVSNDGEPNLDPTQPIRTSRKGARKEYTDKVEFKIVQGRTTQSLFDYDQFGEYEGAVYDAVGTITDSWNGEGTLIIPISLVCQVMSKNNKLPTKEQIQQAKKAIIDWSVVKAVRLDTSDTARMKRLKEDGQYEYDDVYALECQTLPVNCKGNLVECVEVKQKPALYELAKNTEFLIKLDNSIYTIKDAKGKFIADTRMRIAIKRYLVRRVEQHKAALNNANKRLEYHENIQKKKGAEPVKDLTDFLGGEANSNTILMDSVFDAIKLPVDCDKTTKTNIRNYVVTVFEYWKKTKYIKTFNKRTKGKSFDAIVFKVDKKNDQPEEEVEGEQKA